MTPGDGGPQPIPEEDLDVQPYPEHYDPTEFELPWENEAPMGQVLPFPSAAPAAPAASSSVAGTPTASSESSRGKESSIYRGLSALELMELPDPRWLIEPYIQEGAFVLFYSESGVGKSFVALEWALGCASGVLDLGTLHQKGAVAYIAAEGVGGIKKRVRAWQLDRAVAGLNGIWFYRTAYDLLQEVVVSDLIRALSALPERPKLVVVDTFARCAPGADENAAQDMGVFVRRIDLIRQVLGCAVLVVHHAGRDKSHERGSTALRAAADTVFALERKGAQIEVVCKKQKDFDEPPAQGFRLRVVPMPDGETSCVVDTGGRVGPKVTPGALVVLQVMVQQFPAETPSVADLLEATKLKKSTLYARLKELKAALFVIPAPLDGLQVTEVGFETAGMLPQVTTLSSEESSLE